MRKLADFAFMLREWKLAYSTYDIIRKDFANDKAWKYAAGAQVRASIIIPEVGNDSDYDVIVTNSPSATKTRRNSRSIT